MSTPDHTYEFNAAKPVSFVNHLIPVNRRFLVSVLTMKLAGMIPTAKIAAYYDIPIFTAKSTYAELADKKVFKTLTRLSETVVGFF